MKSITLTIEITDEEFDALVKMKELGIAEFRDEDCSWEDYRNSHKEYISLDSENFTEERFLKRNFGGLRKEVLSLYEKDLVQMLEGSWHLSFEISELGYKFF